MCSSPKIMPSNRRLLERMLERCGCRVDAVCDGGEAVERTRAEIYDLVLMDLQMPVLDGLSAAKEIRKDRGLEELTIIALTANAQPEDRQRALSAGMNDFLTKPITMSSLRTVLAKTGGDSGETVTD